ncbi:MAG: HAD hydrolase family protein [Massilibacteroides sp.]|nr:HAD hydrolase family protein [Massilibacteroides sp.]
MSSIPYDLKKIKAFAFDVDGVLSKDIMPLHPNGDPMRTVNTKDGYAMHLAVKHDYRICIITGGNTEAIRLRYERLGVQHINRGSSVDKYDIQDFLDKSGLTPEAVVYVGDDIPDYEVMKRAGLAVAPADAAPEIKEIAGYISSKAGGEGVARDIIEKTMKAQGKWMGEEAFGW